MTTVRCASSVAEPTDRVEIGRLADDYDPALLYVHVFEGTRQAIANPTCADFLAAVEIECGVRIVPADAIVIERAELPRIEPLPSQDSSDSVFVEGVVYDLDSPEPGWHRAEALRRFALAEYLAAHPPVPPVDETDVLLLADLLAGVAPLIAATDTLARRLLATGRVSVTR